MPSVYVQLLAGDQTPSILLFVDGIRYLFNIPEGTQRFCMEHHVKLGKMNGIFLLNDAGEKVVKDTGLPFSSSNNDPALCVFFAVRRPALPQEL